MPKHDHVGARLEVLALVDALRADDTGRLQELVAESEHRPFVLLLNACQLLDGVLRQFHLDPDADLAALRAAVVDNGVDQERDL